MTRREGTRRNEERERESGGTCASLCDLFYFPFLRVSVGLTLFSISPCCGPACLFFEKKTNCIASSARRGYQGGKGKRGAIERACVYIYGERMDGKVGQAAEKERGSEKNKKQANDQAQRTHKHVAPRFVSKCLRSIGRSILNQSTRGARPALRCPLVVVIKKRAS